MESHIIAVSHLGSGVALWLGPFVGVVAVAAMLYITSRGWLGTIAAGRRRTVQLLDGSHTDSLQHGGFYRYQPGMYSHSEIDPEPPAAPAEGKI